MRFLGVSLLLSSIAGASVLAPRDSQSLDECPGYHASSVHQSKNGLTARLQLAGKACNTYGDDLRQLKLEVEYETDSRLHVKISDPDEDVYQVPESVFPPPEGKQSRHDDHKSLLKFSYEKKPFSFSVSRKDTGEVLFDTKISPLVFQSQYLNLRTALPQDPYLFGLGEHTDPFRLNTTDYTLTSWNRDAYSVPPGTNLYSTHPVYIEQRKSGSHGVFLLNSNGVDFKLNQDKHGKQYLEYNVLGGVFDFYFFAGPTPKEVASQYAEVAGLPAMMPYWSFGFHQCRYGYRDVYNVAEVVYNYSQANIPLETMWTDIDYMDGRRIFTLDPDRFPLDKMRELVGYLHDHDQHYVVMVDPAVSYSDNPAFNHGKEQGIFMKEEDGSIYKGAVWPGVTAYPDWFHPDTSKYWINEFGDFFSADHGVDIDALWIDMNEASNFCPWPCSDPEKYSEESDLPPAPPAVRPNPRPLPGFPSDFQPPKAKRGNNHGKKLGLPNRDLINPPYSINNEAGSLSNKTVSTNLVHANGLVEYDTHNLYGIMMSIASRDALLHRRPSVRPLVITRSTYAGAGSHVGKWLGDNISTWQHYRISIAQMLAFASIFQVPMIGSDVCGFGGNTDEKLCARWTTLGAFYPFFRNHNGEDSIDQEFYRWDSVAETARQAIERRYKLLDYIYTAFHRQSTTGEPLLNPLFYIYPEDENTYPIDLQFFYGDAILVSPVTDDNSTSVDIYLPDDIFYEYSTGKPVRGHGKTVHLDNVPFSDIPLHIRGGSIIPLRKESAATTTELRKKPFELIIAPDSDGKASGSLYLDDGESINQPATIDIKFSYDGGKFRMDGKFDLKVSRDILISSVTVLGVDGKPKKLAKTGGAAVKFDYHPDNKKVTANVDLPLTGPAEIDLS